MSNKSVTELNSYFEQKWSACGADKKFSRCGLAKLFTRRIIRPFSFKIGSKIYEFDLVINLLRHYSIPLLQFAAKTLALEGMQLSN
jgi:hypothetical protein